MLLARYSEFPNEAGCDEAGRGCLAGPVFAAAVIFPDDYCNNELNDSKKLGALKRNKLRKIIEHDALAWSVASVDAEEIDVLNILNASFLAMHKAIEQLLVIPSFLLIDGNRFLAYKNISCKCIIHGDALYQSIAAASILAKSYRDEYMDLINGEFPYYGWIKNKGYPTKEHHLAIARYGLSPYHRKSFNMNPQLKINF
ncbi:MAG: ribonuclease HII [Lentimicrobiaceae bacterium]|nr:ribonuclease HII [Lentimicrobiaceae bacterium]